MEIASEKRLNGVVNRLTPDNQSPGVAQVAGPASPVRPRNPTVPQPCHGCRLRTSRRCSRGVVLPGAALAASFSPALLSWRRSPRRCTRGVDLPQCCSACGVALLAGALTALHSRRFRETASWRCTRPCSRCRPHDRSCGGAACRQPSRRFVGAREGERCRQDGDAGAQVALLLPGDECHHRGGPAGACQPGGRPQRWTGQREAPRPVLPLNGSRVDIPGNPGRRPRPRGW